MGLSEQLDIGNRIRSRTAIVNTAIQQTSAANPSSDTGVTIDRQAAGLRHYYSAKAVVSGAFTGGSSLRTVTLAISMQHSSDGTSWDAYSTGTEPSAVQWGSSSTGNTAGTTAGTEYNTVEQRVQLASARRYIRVNLEAATFNNSSSGDLNVHGVLIFGGPDELEAQ